MATVTTAPTTQTGNGANQDAKGAEPGLQAESGIQSGAAPTWAGAGTNGDVATADVAQPKELLVGAYRTIYLSRKLDDKEIQLKRQNRIYFQINGVGHEALNVACARHLRAGYDWFYPYYRDRALCLELGMTPLDMLLEAVGAKDDPQSAGRQMPSHWGFKPAHIVSQSSPTGTQALQALGAAAASLYYRHVREAAELAASFHDDEVVYVSVGDGATSEGEFWETLNGAALNRAPLVIVVEDNGYAISVPVDAQTAGANISRLVRDFPNFLVEECDGTDFAATYVAPAARWITPAAAGVRRCCTPMSSGPIRTRCRTTRSSTSPRRAVRRKPRGIRSSACAGVCSTRAWQATRSYRGSRARSTAN